MKLDSNQFRPHFSEYWWNRLGKWFDTEEAAKLYGKLKERSNNGARILPTSDRTFRAFKLSNGNPVAILIGLTPYQTIGRNTRPHADGLAFSTSLSKEETPSLKSFYDAMEVDLERDVIREPNLGYLAEQNVLLLNYSLTCELGKATIHADMNLWDDFNKFLYKEVLTSACGIPIVLMGKVAHSLEKYMFNLCHVIKKVEHPVMAAREHREWKHDGLFNWCNKVITENNGELYKIWWDYADIQDIPF